MIISLSWVGVFKAAPRVITHKLNKLKMRTVQELTQDELEELRSRYYYQGLDDGSLEEVVGRDVESEHDIPMDLVKSHYADTYFVEEDFWCNIKV